MSACSSSSKSSQTGRLVFASISPLALQAGPATQSNAPAAPQALFDLCCASQPGQQVVQLLHTHAAPLAFISFPGFGESSSSSSRSGTSSSAQQQQQQQQSQRRFPPWLKQQQPLESTSEQQQPPPSKNKLRTRRNDESPSTSPNTLAVEVSAGRQRVYRLRQGQDSGTPWVAFDMVEDPQTHQRRLENLVKSYLLPQGFPDSVAPQYASYMFWRGVQYCFGGAISVFTTKSLLGALGVGGRHAGEAAAAINWVLKDGAGRLGRFLFARWGRELDCELKQFRLAGDILMEAGAALELSTIAAPRLFLPLACTANLAKNLAAVAASSTRAPIYRTFALQNNLADVTAKGESVANLADILGTLVGIALSKARLPLLPTFAVLSAGYLVASRREVDSVELPYFNRARLAYSSCRFLATGQVPDIAEANHREPLLPWAGYNQGAIVLGATLEAACATPTDLAHASALFAKERYVMTYRPDTKKVYILLRETATSLDCLKATFSAHVLLQLWETKAAAAAASKAAAAAAAAAASSGSTAAGAVGSSSSSSGGGGGSAGGRGSTPAAATTSSSGSKDKQQKASTPAAATSNDTTSSGGGSGLLSPPSIPDVKETITKLKSLFKASADEQAAARQLLADAKPSMDQLYGEFSRQADKQGWKLQSTMLNPRETRILKVSALAVTL